MGSEQRRIEWIDYVRAFAIICVVLCHATEGIYSLDLNPVLSLSTRSRIFLFSSFTFGRLGVPLFLMITGSLLLSKEYDSNRIVSFWKTNWLHLLLCVLFWFAVYDVFLAVYYHQSFNTIQILEEFLFMRNVNMNHVWYMTMILGMYILLPFVAGTLNNYDAKIFIFPLIIYTFYVFVPPLLDVIFRACAMGPVSNQFSYGFSGGEFGMYIIFGYFISKKNLLKRFKSLIVVLLSIIGFTTVVSLQLLSYAKGVGYVVWYNNFLLLVTTMCIYELISRIGKTIFYNVVKYISAYSFPIYLTHNIIRKVITKHIINLQIIKPLQVLCLSCGCFAGGLLVSILIRNIPKLGDYILYIKKPKHQ